MPLARALCCSHRNEMHEEQPVLYGVRVSSR